MYACYDACDWHLKIFTSTKGKYIENSMESLSFVSVMGRAIPAPDGWAWWVLHIEACYAPLTASTAKASTEPGSLRMVGSEPGRKQNVKQQIMWNSQIAWNQSNVTKVNSRQTCHVSLTNQIAEMDLASMLFDLNSTTKRNFYFPVVVRALETDQKPKHGISFEGKEVFLKKN